MRSHPTTRLLWSAFLGAALCAAPGCTSFHITQTDESPQERAIRTEIRAVAWFSSAQSVTKLKALQTDKTQSFGTDSLAQQGATNSVAALIAIARILEAIRPAP